ncbi:hypothetical protein Aau02nite_00260 [Amorphoplanes auranticolor]|uniref:Uncharacterized protein n=1 Tax=Actinoplanes auranticolor TaxID=47988 RepID=A0A919S2M1_9ACTN|nr:hypothetical protein Aau02nite_00260 [Actinoplanes auranticolor]
MTTQLRAPIRVESDGRHPAAVELGDGVVQQGPWVDEAGVYRHGCSSARYGPCTVNEYTYGTSSVQSIT